MKKEGIVCLLFICIIRGQLQIIGESFISCFEGALKRVSYADQSGFPSAGASACQPPAIYRELRKNQLRIEGGNGVTERFPNRAIACMGSSGRTERSLRPG